MPLDFPTSPTDGQTYNGYVFSTSVGAWQAKPSAQSPFYTSDTPPSNPTKGDSWFNTNDGTMYIYTYDGNSYQWVEHRSQIAKSQVGLVPIVPTSVTVGSGTATVDTGGLVTFTGISSIALNGVFTSAYANYRYILSLKGVGSGTTGLVTRLRASGTNTSTGYYWGGYIAYIAANSLSSYRADNGGEILSGFVSGSSFSAASVDLFSPQKAEVTSFTTQSTGSDGSYFTLNNSGFQISSTQFDGISIQTSANSLTGSLKIYGYS